MVRNGEHKCSNKGSSSSVEEKTISEDEISVSASKVPGFVTLENVVRENGTYNAN